MSTTISRVGDSELVARALRGDRAAVGEIYDRYVDSIYSFCRSRLRNDADAADATQDTFVRAATRLSQLREPSKLRSWLYAIARNQIIATGRATARLSGDDDMDLIIAPDAEPDIDLLRVEAAQQLWAAAEGLSDRDQEVLELHLRHGLVGQDLADSLGVSESHANVLLSRMRDRVATCMGSLLVAREGRENCSDLDLLLAAWDGRFTLDIRSRVTRHVRSCDTCEQTQTRVLASGVSFGILPIIPAPSTLRIDTLAKMSDALGLPPAASAPPGGSVGSLEFADPIPSLLLARDPDGWEWKEDGFPGALSASTSRGAVLLSAAAVFVVLVVLGGITAAVFNDDSGIETAAAVQVAAAVETAPPSTDPAGESSTSEPAQIAAAPTPPEATPSTVEQTSTTPGAATDPSSTAAVSSGSESSTSSAAAPPATDAAPPTTPSTAPAVTTTTTSTTTSTSTSTTTSTSTSTSTTTTTTQAPPNQKPVFARAAARPALVQVDRGRCKGETADLIVQVSDPDGEIESVVADWFSGVGRTRQVKLVPVVGAADGTYVGTIGTWVEEGRQTSTIRAWDNNDESTATSVTVTVTACPAG